MKIDHRIVFLFEQALPTGATLLPYFPMLQFTRNESDTKIRYVCESCFTRMVLKVCVSFYYCRCTRTQVKLSVVTDIEISLPLTKKCSPVIGARLSKGVARSFCNIKIKRNQLTQTRARNVR